MTRDPVLVFALLMLILLLAPALATRARLPGVVGLIAAGALLGPHALRALERTETLDTLGRLGLLYLMFMAGLSLDLQQFVALRRRSLAFGLVSYGIPHLLAMGVAWALDLGLLPALLLGAICGTHTLLALPVAQRLGLTRHPMVTVTAGGTLVCDALGMTVLAAVVGVHGGQSGGLFWLGFAVRLAVFITAVLVLVPRLGRWVLRRVSLDPTGELAFLLLVLFGTAFAATLAGLAPIVGAFLAGLTLNRMVPAASGIMGRVAFVGDSLFVPFFLISVGMLVDPAVLAGGGRTWVLAALLVGTVYIGKLAAAWLAARRFTGAFGPSGWLMVGLSTPQAAGTLAVTLVGYQLTPRLFDLELVNAVVVLIVVTCVVGPWLVDRAGRRAALEEDALTAPLGEDAPRILIPLANPHTAGALVDLAIMLRDPSAADPIHPMTVVRDGPRVREQVARNEQLLAEAVLHAVAAGAPVQPVTRVDLNVVHAMVRAVKELRTSLVVIGWGGEPSAGERVFGGVLDQLLEQCGEMVLVSKTVEPVNTAERVLLIVPRHAARQEGFRRAAHAAKTLARNIDAELVVLADPADQERLAEDLVGVRPALPFTTLPLTLPRADDEESDAVAPLARIVTEHDLLVVVGARRETVAWGPALARLPGKLSTSFPARTLVVIHPAQLAGARPLADDPSTTSSSTVVVLPTGAQRAQGPEPVSDLLRRLLSAELGDQPDALEGLLARLMASGVHEVRPGMAFLHARAERWTEPRLFVGDAPGGLVVPNTEAPVTVVVAVVSPWGQTPERHLRDLALVARAALQLDLDRLRSTTRVADLEQALQATALSREDVAPAPTPTAAS